MQKLLERFTKEQLIERLKHRISVAEKYPDLEEAQYDEAIFKIALAAIDGKYPAIPDGWKLVPIEPTEDMVIDGFESEPDEHFSDEQEPVAWQFLDDGKWFTGSGKNNHRQNTEAAGYPVRNLYAAALLPPEMTMTDCVKKRIDTEFMAGYNQAISDAKALGCQSAKVVKLPPAEKDGGTDWQGDITAGCVNRMRDKCLAALDAAGVKWVEGE